MDQDVTDPMRLGETGRSQVARRRAKGFSPRQLRAARLRAGYSQAQLAIRASLSSASVSAYERGKTTPTAPVLKALAEALQVQVDELTVIRTDTAALAELRYNTGLTQATIATKLEIAPGTFPAIERGEQPLTVAQIKALAAIYKVTPEDIQAAWERTRAIVRGTPPAS